MYELIATLLVLLSNHFSNNLYALATYGITNPNQVACSYYSTGRWTANCEQFNPWGLTCASPIETEEFPALPFGTLLYVTVDGHSFFVLRVNDRGPFAVTAIGRVIYPLRRHPTRQLDLTYGAFGDIFGSWEQGTDVLRIVRVEFPEVEERGGS